MALGICYCRVLGGGTWTISPSMTMYEFAAISSVAAELSCSVVSYTWCALQGAGLSVECRVLSVEC